MWAKFGRKAKRQSNLLTSVFANSVKHHRPQRLLKLKKLKESLFLHPASFPNTIKFTKISRETLSHLSSSDGSTSSKRLNCHSEKFEI